MATISVVAWFYDVAKLSNAKNDPSYSFGSNTEKFISCLNASIAFDSILIAFSIVVIVAIRLKLLNWPLAMIFATYFCLFFFGKGMAGGFYLKGSSNEEIHNQMKDIIYSYSSNSIPLPEMVVAWQYSYYMMIASVLGELIWVIGSSMMLILEGRKVFFNIATI